MHLLWNPLSRTSLDILRALWLIRLRRMENSGQKIILLTFGIQGYSAVSTFLPPREMELMPDQTKLSWKVFACL